MYQAGDPVLLLFYLDTCENVCDFVFRPKELFRTLSVPCDEG